MHIKILFLFIFNFAKCIESFEEDLTKNIKNAKLIQLDDNSFTIFKENGEKNTHQFSNNDKLLLANQKNYIIDLAKYNGFVLQNHDDSLSRKLNMLLTIKEWMPIISTLIIGLSTFCLLFFPEKMDGYNVFTFHRILAVKERLNWDKKKEKEYKKFSYFQNNIFEQNTVNEAYNNYPEFEKCFRLTEPINFNFIQIAFSFITLGILTITLTTTINMLIAQKNKIKIRFKTNNINFNLSQIAGNNDTKKILRELIFVINNSEICKKRSIKTPKGVLFYGPPGNGKTLLAQALANEINVPFIALSASDFSSEYGANIIKNIFKIARSTQKCVMFIDEIDAIAISRDHPQCTQNSRIMLSNLLTQIDGMDNKNGPEIILIAATNKIEDIDTALLRPGRLDTTCFINYPNFKERIEILKLYTKNLIIEDDVDFNILSEITEGFSGAQLFKVVNNANILSVCNAKEIIKQSDFEESIKFMLKQNQDESLFKVKYDIKNF